MTINYQALVNESMLNIISKVLKDYSNNELHHDQCFYISFQTNYNGVILSPRVKSKYPNDITIVLEHQFRDLKVFDGYFTVNISFNGVNETISVPLKALTSFIDPMSNFSLQLNNQINKNNTEQFRVKEDLSENNIKNIDTEILSKQKTDSLNNNPGEVVELNKFRNKFKK